MTGGGARNIISEGSRDALRLIIIGAESGLDWSRRVLQLKTSRRWRMWLHPAKNRISSAQSSRSRGGDHREPARMETSQGHAHPGLPNANLLLRLGFWRGRPNNKLWKRFQTEPFHTRCVALIPSVGAAGAKGLQNEGVAVETVAALITTPEANYRNLNKLRATWQCQPGEGKHTVVTLVLI